jgi:hypothetical protein
MAISRHHDVLGGTQERRNHCTRPAHAPSASMTRRPPSSGKETRLGEVGMPALSVPEAEPLRVALRLRGRALLAEPVNIVKAKRPQ